MSNTLFSYKTIKLQKYINTFAYLLICTLLTGCGVYSFSGASIDPNAKTVSVDFFENTAPVIVPTLSQNFTEGLKDKITNATPLSLIKNNGDVAFSGEIIDYSAKPIAVQGNEIAATSRLTISVKVNYMSKQNEKQNWENTFTRYADFPSTKNISDVQDELIQQINAQLLEDIFNKAFVNW